MDVQLSNAGVQALLDAQLGEWEQAKNNYSALEGVTVKEVLLNGFPVKVQFNPARIVSSAAKVDAKSIRERKCFLCAENRPAVQRGIAYKGKAGEYEVLINPFPIFPKHLTIPDKKHLNQTIWAGENVSGRMEDMLDLAAILDEYVLFYNGPKCGASAPDHMHFQAGNKGFLPVETHRDRLPATPVFEGAGVRVLSLEKYMRGALLLEATDKAGAIEIFNKIYAAVPVKAGEWEPMLNVLCWSEKPAGGERKWYTVVFIRDKHRPSHYFAEGDANILLSPASVDLGGVFITPLEKDFIKLGSKEIAEMMDEIFVSGERMDMIRNLLREQPQVSVGIQHEKEIAFVLNDIYLLEGSEYSGEQKAEARNGKVFWNGQAYTELLFRPKWSGTFWLKGVTIGVNFHWERKEDQRFGNTLKIIVEDGKLTAVNLIGVEDYLTSVISSEMSATASLELLKAHAVISRSWLLAQIEKNKEITANKTIYSTCTQTEEEFIRWYDREDHVNFDVCADDHCQRYQGLTRASTPKVREAVAATWGELLVSDGKICDARFSKCCGGVMEEFQNCWEPVKYSYLRAYRDSCEPQDVPDLTAEENARKWIMGAPDAFCNTTDKKILNQVLNNYDQETVNFYRWKQEYGQDELRELIRSRSGVDYGGIKALIPVERGPSARLIRLKIVGTRKSRVIGKELEIRRTLSTSHLYSSAFVVDTEGECLASDGSEVPEKFILSGAGWGHGVGLCQIGAAVMGEQGYPYQEILLHYYIEADIRTRY